MGLSLLQVKQLENLIDSMPTHDIILTDALTQELLEITDTTCRHQGLLPIDIPGDIVLAHTIPTTDLYIRLTEMSAKARIVIFNKSLANAEIIDGLIPIGMVIYDYGVTKPEVFFGVDRKERVLKIIDKEGKWWYGARTQKQNSMFRARFGLENRGKIQMTEIVLRIWYGIQEAFMYETLHKSQRDQLNVPVRYSISELQEWPKKILMKTDPNRKFQRHKCQWFRLGHWHTFTTFYGRPLKVPKIIWLDGVWCFASHDNEESEETYERIKNDIDRKERKSRMKPRKKTDEIYPMGKTFTTDFETRHTDTTITLCVKFDEEFKSKLIDSGLYLWRFVIGVNDMIPFLYESDGWMKDHIKKDNDDKNVWCFTEPFNLPMKAGDTVKIKAVIMDIETTKERIIADMWKLNSDGKWVCVG